MIPAPPKLNPSAAVLIAAAAASTLGANTIARAEAGMEPTPPMHPIERRRQPAPPGYKKVFHGHQPHQGSKECLRRMKQMAKASLKSPA